MAKSDDDEPLTGEVWEFWDPGQQAKILTIGEDGAYPRTMYRRYIRYEPSTVTSIDPVRTHVADALRGLADDIEAGTCTGVAIGAVHLDGGDRQMSWYAEQRDQLVLLGLLDVMHAHTMRVATLHDIEDLIDELG